MIDYEFSLEAEYGAIVEIAESIGLVVDYSLSPGKLTESLAYQCEDNVGTAATVERREYWYRLADYYWGITPFPAE